MHPTIGKYTTLGSYGRPVPRMCGTPYVRYSLKLSDDLQGYLTFMIPPPRRTLLQAYACGPKGFWRGGRFVVGEVPLYLTDRTSHPILGSHVCTPTRATGVPRSFKTAPPLRTIIGPQTWSYCRVLGGRCFL